MLIEFTIQGLTPITIQLPQAEILTTLAKAVVMAPAGDSVKMPPCLGSE